MGDQTVTPSGEGHDVQLWDARRALRRIGVAEAGLSCGFLRCRPEKWFPGFASHWLTVIHSLGIEAKLSEIKPVLAKPPVDDVAFVGSVSGEEMLLAIDANMARALSDELVPGAGERASAVVLEYFFRRLLSSLVLSWSGPESATVSFKRGGDPSQVHVVGSVRVSFTINTVPFTLWFGLGPKMIDVFDGLWRRQVQSLSKTVQTTSVVRIEIAQLGVPPQMLSEYLTKGTVIDLEVKASESVTLKIGNKAWMPARLVDVGGKLGCEMAPGALAVPPVVEGATQLCVEFGTCELDGPRLAELGQGGAVLITDIASSGTVNLVINQERVGTARLCVYEGRFAIEVQ